MGEPLRDEHVHKEAKEHREASDPQVVSPAEEHRYDERRVIEPERDSLVAITAIRYAAIVIIVIAILYFLAIYLIPALTGR